MYEYERNRKIYHNKYNNTQVNHKLNDLGRKRMKFRNKAITDYNHTYQLHKRRVTINDLKGNLMKIALDYDELFPTSMMNGTQERHYLDIYGKDGALRRIERLNNKERDLINWMTSQIKSTNFRRAYQYRRVDKSKVQNNKRKHRRQNWRDEISKPTKKELRGLVPSYTYSNEISLFGKTLTPNERKNYFGLEPCHGRKSCYGPNEGKTIYRSNENYSRDLQKYKTQRKYNSLKPQYQKRLTLTLRKTQK